MMELTKALQGKDELVVDFINHERSLSLNNKDRLSEISSIEMCIQGVNWYLHYILKELKPNIFEQLTTRADDME